MSLIYFFLSLTVAWGASLNIVTPANWVVRENFLGFDYVVVEQNHDKNSLMIKKTAYSVFKGALPEALRKLIYDKKSSTKNSWSEIKIVDEFLLKKGSNSLGKAFVVEHLKQEIPFTSLVGAFSADSDYYFVYFSDSRENFNRKKAQVLKIINEIKIKK